MSRLHAKDVSPDNAIDHGQDNSIVAAKKRFLEDHPSAVELSRRQKRNLKTKAKFAEAVNRACQAELIADEAIEARNLETQARFAAERSTTKVKTERDRLAREVRELKAAVIFALTCPRSTLPV